jgi:hypothetical protein
MILYIIILYVNKILYIVETDYQIQNYVDSLCKNNTTIIFTKNSLNV